MAQTAFCASKHPVHLMLQILRRSVMSDSHLGFALILLQSASFYKSCNTGLK